LGASIFHKNLKSLAIFQPQGKRYILTKLKYSIKQQAYQQAICLLSQAKFGLQVRRELVGIKALAIENWGKI